MRRISKKRLLELPEYNVLISELRRMCSNRSELSGEWADWQTHWDVEPHHIRGRIGKRFLDPFNIILLTRSEHDIQESKIRGQKYSKEELEVIVKPIRISQGFEEG